MNGSRMFMTGALLALAGGWFVLPRAFYGASRQPLQFSHKVHASEGSGLACEDCHGFTEEGRFTGVPSVGRCAECHEDALGESSQEKALIEEYVQPGKEIPWLVYSRQPDNVNFQHVQHVKKAGLACDVCHGPHGESETLRPYGVDRVSGYSRDVSARRLAGIGGGPAWGLSMDDCMRCHVRMGAANTCITCHK